MHYCESVLFVSPHIFRTTWFLKAESSFCRFVQPNVFQGIPVSSAPPTHLFCWRIILHFLICMLIRYVLLRLSETPKKAWNLMIRYLFSAISVSCKWFVCDFVNFLILFTRLRLNRCVRDIKYVFPPLNILWIFGSLVEHTNRPLSELVLCAFYK